MLASPSNKREAILTAALDLFVEKGISAATTREIARRANTAEGNLYRHFPSKDHLARHLFGECAGRFRKMLTEAVAEKPDPVERLRSLVRTLFRFAHKEPTAFAYLLLSHHGEFETGPIRNPQPLPKDIFTDTIRSGVKSGQFRGVEPEMATSWVIGMTQRAITFHQAGKISLPREEIVERTAEAAIRLLAARA